MDRDFDPVESAPRSKSVQGESAIGDVSRKRRSRKSSSSGVTEEIEVIDSEIFEPKMVRSRKLPTSMKTALQVGKERKKDTITEIEPKVKTTIQGTTEKLAGTGESLELPVVKTSQTSTTK